MCKLTSGQAFGRNTCLALTYISRPNRQAITRGFGTLNEKDKACLERVAECILFLRANCQLTDGLVFAQRRGREKGGFLGALGSVGILEIMICFMFFGHLVRA